MTYKSPYGQSDGIERRLNTWANQLSLDKKFPWVGTGLIDDLKQAASMLGAPPFEAMFPDKTYFPKTQPVPVEEPEEWEKQFSQPVEFDL